MRRIAFIGCLILLAPSVAQACAVCFGQDTESHQIQAVMWGMFILLGMVLSLFAGIAAFIWNIKNRTRLAEN